MNWFNETLRKIHIIYVSPQWVAHRGERFDAREYVRPLKEAGVTAIELYAKDHYGVCYYPSSLGLPYPIDVVAAIADECRNAGLRLMAYFSVCFDNYILGCHPEWRATTGDGEAIKVGPFFLACPNSGYRQYALTQLGELVARYPFDGFWLDIIPLAWGGPPQWMIHGQTFPCYCLGCQRAFRDRYGKALPRNPTPAELRECFQFMTDATASFLQDMYATIRTSLPDAVITYNAAGAPGDPIDSADLTSIEAHAPNYTRQSFLARWGRSRGKPLEILTPQSVNETPNGWDSWDLKPAQLLEFEMAVVAVQGGTMTLGFPPYPSGGVEKGWFDVYSHAYRQIEKLEPLVRQATGVYDAGIVLAQKPVTAAEQWTPMFMAAEAAHELLLHEHVLDAVVPTVQDLDRFSLVIIPHQTALSEAEAERIREYVRNGGALLVTGESGLLDDAGRQRDDFVLADVLGVHFLGRSQVRRAYGRLLEGPLAADIVAMPLSLDQAPVEVRVDGGHVLATFSPGEAELTDATSQLWGFPAPADEPNLPLAVANHFGQGRCLYLAINPASRGLQATWQRAMVRSALRYLLPKPLVVVQAPPFVEVVLNKQAHRHILHLLNYSVGDPNATPLPPEARVRGIQIQCNLRRLGPLTRASVATSGEEVPTRVDGESLIIEVPPLGVQTALLVE